MRMDATQSSKLEGNREGFKLENLRKAQALAWQGLRKIREAMQVGMTEREICALGARILKEAGSKKNWHRVIARIDESTLLKFSEPADPDKKLTANSIVFLDVGPVFEIEGMEYEGDVGDTFVFGEDPEKHRLADACRELFHTVAGIWRNESLTGVELYARAEREAEKIGVKLLPNVDGHRAGDFPHQVFFRGGIGELDFKPSVGVWILEIQLRHPTLPFGEFFEDSLG
jgi:Xaa-Pro aminopeptidase